MGRGKPCPYRWRDAVLGQGRPLRSPKMRLPKIGYRKWWVKPNCSRRIAKSGGSGLDLAIQAERKRGVR